MTQRAAEQVNALRPSLRVLRRYAAPRHGLTHLCVCVALFCAWATPRNKSSADHVTVTTARLTPDISDDELDAGLQRAATNALGARDGAIVVLDPQTGRVRAAVNPRLAAEQAFPPGSAIKPFTLLTALRTGALKPDTRLLCRKRYARADTHFTCSHPASLPPFTPAQALAYSCNYYFARLGERLKPDDFNQTLAAYGFGTRTGLADEFEGAGKLPRGRWRVSETLGEGEDLLVTPLQLLTAYAALLNGGHLYAPQQSASESFQAHERAMLELMPAERALLLTGMRGAVAYGTAERAHLDALPVSVFGKTGTATEVGGFHTHGWFVGFAAGPAANDAQELPTIAPAEFKLAVLVFLKRATGAQSASLAQPILAAYARATVAPPDQPTQRAAAPQPAIDDEAAQAASARGEPVVRVHLVREDVTRALTLEDYTFGALAAEASTETEYEALKVQAVVSRTFALRNLHRHARDGYDFCNLTHCQRYLAVTDKNTRTEFHALLRRAVQETAGEVLRDGRGALANTYFSASCGGITANVESLWGVAAHERYERGVRDEFCAGAPYSSWTDVLPAAQLARALHEDERADVGARVDDIKVIKRDTSGRAELVAVSGERRRVLRGWDFKTIVGRTLGWNLIKSSRFTVERTGANFVFRGSGFGHGLGLCQMGAHAQAARGITYQQILAYYFPGTYLTHLADIAQWHDDVLLTSHQADVAAPTLEHAPAPSPSPAAPAPRTLAAEHFRVRYSAPTAQRDVEDVLRMLAAARTDVAQRLAAASLQLPALPVLEIVAHETTGDFVGATAQPAYAAAAMRGHSIHLQPLAILRRRGVLATTLRHEYAHAVIAALSHERAPRWLAEGLAAYTAGEGALLTKAQPPQNISIAQLEQKLAQPGNAQELRALYAAAYRAVSALVQQEGEARVWQRVARS